MPVYGIKRYCFSLFKYVYLMVVWCVTYMYIFYWFINIRSKSDSLKNFVCLALQNETSFYTFLNPRHTLQIIWLSHISSQKSCSDRQTMKYHFIWTFFPMDRSEKSHIYIILGTTWLQPLTYRLYHCCHVFEHISFHMRVMYKLMKWVYVREVGPDQNLHFGVDATGDWFHVVL